MNYKSTADLSAGIKLVMRQGIQIQKVEQWFLWQKPYLVNIEISKDFCDHLPVLAAEVPL